MVLGVIFLAYPKPKTLQINGEVFYIETAKTHEERSLGLMHRDHLESKNGMLFVYPSETAPIFWMKNTLIPLDMVFISGDKRINYFQKNALPCPQDKGDDCPSYSSPYPTQYVLELNAGEVEKFKLREGDEVAF